MKLALTLPGMQRPIDTNVPVPTGGLFTKGTEIISVLLTLFVLISIFTTLYFIVVAGFNLITSRGHKENIKNNRDAIMYATLGLFLIFISFFAVNVIGSVLGINFFCFLFGQSCH